MPVTRAPRDLDRASPQSQAPSDYTRLAIVASLYPSAGQMAGPPAWHLSASHRHAGEALAIWQTGRVLDQRLA